MEHNETVNPSMPDRTLKSSDSKSAYAMEGRHLKIGYSDKTIIPEMNVKIPQGQITSIIGPNGCGKSTLLKGLARILPLQGGEVLLHNQNMKDMGTKEIARQLALLPQGPTAPAGLSVRELVSFGRYPYQKGFGTMNETDRQIVEQAMKDTRTLELADRSVDQLSGGQRQRVWIAMALAQDTPLILLDEPTTYLDMAHQLEILELLERLNKEKQKTIVIVIHDLNLAARFSDYLVAMKDGLILHEGNVGQIMSAPVLNDVFSLDALIEKDPWTGKPTMVSYRLLSGS